MTLANCTLIARRPSANEAGHISSCHGSCECHALSAVAAACRWPSLLLSPLLSSARQVRAWPPSPARLRSLCTAPSPHRTDCCRSIRRRKGVKGGFACTFNQTFSPVLVALRSQPPLTPDQRRITIRRQSGGGPLHLPGSCRHTPGAPCQTPHGSLSGQLCCWHDHQPGRLRVWICRSARPQVRRRAGSSAGGDDGHAPADGSL